MKQRFQRMVFSVLFAVSLCTAGPLLVTQAQAWSLGAKCPSCDNRQGCAGSTCTCNFLDTGLTCQP
jgi:hypothetical protein